MTISQSWKGWILYVKVSSSSHRKFQTWRHLQGSISQLSDLNISSVISIDTAYISALHQWHYLYTIITSVLPGQADTLRKWIFIKGFLGPKTCSPLAPRQGSISLPWSALPKNRDAHSVQSIKCGTEVMRMWLRGILVYLIKSNHLYLCILAISEDSLGPSISSPFSSKPKSSTNPLLKINFNKA